MPTMNDTEVMTLDALIAALTEARKTAGNAVVELILPDDGPITARDTYVTASGRVFVRGW